MKIVKVEVAVTAVRLLPVPVAGVTLVGENWQVAPTGAFIQERATGFVKAPEPSEFTLITYRAGVPCVTVPEEPE